MTIKYDENNQNDNAHGNVNDPQEGIDLVRRLLAIASLLLAAVTVLFGYVEIRRTWYPCSSLTGNGPFSEDAMGAGYQPPEWDKGRVIQTLERRKIPYREEGDKVLVPACGANWLGSTWW